MVCANGKQKSVVISSVRIGHLPFTPHKTPVYRESLGRIEHGHNSKMAVKNCKCNRISTQILQLVILEHLSRRSVYFENLSVSRNFQNLRVNGKQLM